MDTNNWKENFARIGIATKGVVYCLAGILTTMAAIGAGGKKADSNGVFSFIEDQAFGKILLILIILGLSCYVFWRFYQAIADPENEAQGDGYKPVLKRFSFAGSGVIYGLLTFSAIRMLTNQSSGRGQNSEQKFVATLLESPLGQWAVGLVAVILLAKAIHQFYKAYTGDYAKKIQGSRIDVKAKDVVYKAGKFGYIARGVVVAIIAYFFFRAAIEANPAEAQGKEGAFNFIQQSDWGNILLAILALGLAAYGAFLIIKARYRDMASV